MRLLLVALLALFPTIALAQDIAIGVTTGARPRTGGATPVNQFFTGARSEPSTPWGTDNIQYSTALSDNYEFTGAEGASFDVVGADGEFCNLQISQRGGTIDAADSGAVVTLRLCAGGDVSGGCTWADTTLAVTVASDDTTTDVSWTDTDCVAVSAGDAVGLEWDLSGVSSTVWIGGEAEAPETYIEFHGTNSNESFITANAIQSTAFQSQYAWGLGGTDTSMVDEDSCTAAGTPYACCTGLDTGTCSELSGTPIPGDFTLKAVYATFESDPASTTAIYVCEDDAGTATECDGIGTLITTVSIASGAASNSSQTGLSHALSDGDRLFFRTTRNDSNNFRGVSLQFANTSQQWWSTTRAGLDITNTLAFGGMRGRSVTMCNQFTAEDPQCMPRIVTGGVASSMSGWFTEAVTDSAGTDATFTVTLRETAVSGMACQFTHSNQTCADNSGDGSLDANDFISVTSVPANGINNTDAFWAVSTLWESQ